MEEENPNLTLAEVALLRSKIESEISDLKELNSVSIALVVRSGILS